MDASPLNTIDWQTMPDSTRVWIYQASRPLTNDEVIAIEKAGQVFVSEWSSHGADMAAVLEVLHNRFLVLFADEAQAKASGCGIDKSVRFIQELGEHYEIDFFDRMTICYLEGEEVKECQLSEIPSMITKGSITSDTLFFDNLVPDKGSLISRWKRKMGEGWLSRYF